MMLWSYHSAILWTCVLQGEQPLLQSLWKSSSRTGLVATSSWTWHWAGGTVGPGRSRFAKHKGIWVSLDAGGSSVKFQKYFAVSKQLIHCLPFWNCCQAALCLHGLVPNCCWRSGRGSPKGSCSSSRSAASATTRALGPVLGGEKAGAAVCSAPSDRPLGFPCTQQLLLEAQTSLHGDSSSEIRISLQETFPVSAEKKKNNSPHCLQTQGCIKGSSDISEKGGRLCTGCRWGGIEFFCIRMSMERVVQNYFYPLLCLFFFPSWLIKGFLSLSEELLPISDDKLSSPVSARWCTLCWLFIIIFHGSSCWLPLPSLCFCLW